MDYYDDTVFVQSRRYWMGSRWFFQN